MRDSIFGAESRANRSAITASIFNGAMSYGFGGGHSTAKLVQTAAGHIPNINGGEDAGFQLYWGDLASKTNNDQSRMAAAALADIRADSFRLERFVQAYTEVAVADEKQILNTQSSSHGNSSSKQMQDDLANALKNETKRQSERLEIIISLAQLKKVYEQAFVSLQIENSPKAQEGLATLSKYERVALEDFNRCNKALETVNLGIGNEFGEKISALTHDKFSSESERAILSESILGGAATGLAVGAIAALIFGHSTKDTIIGAGIGSLSGALVGRAIGIDRVREIKDLNLENSKMKDLLQKADITNKKIADNNRELSDQIASLLREKVDEERKMLAQKKLYLAQEQQKEVKKLMEDRTVIANALYSKQKQQYEKRLEELKKQDKTLDDLIKNLGEVAKSGRIG